MTPERLAEIRAYFEEQRIEQEGALALELCHEIDALTRERDEAVETKEQREAAVRSWKTLEAENARLAAELGERGEALDRVTKLFCGEVDERERLTADVAKLREVLQDAESWRSWRMPVTISYKIQCVLAETAPKEGT